MTAAVHNCPWCGSPNRSERHHVYMNATTTPSPCINAWHDEDAVTVTPPASDLVPIEARRCPTGWWLVEQIGVEFIVSDWNSNMDLVRRTNASHRDIAQWKAGGPL